MPLAEYSQFMHMELASHQYVIHMSLVWCQRAIHMVFAWHPHSTSMVWYGMVTCEPAPYLHGVVEGGGAANVQTLVRVL